MLCRAPPGSCNCGMLVRPHTRLVLFSWRDGTVRFARFPGGGCGCSESDGGGSICRAHGGLDTGGHELEDSAQWYPRCLTTSLRLDPHHDLRAFDCIVSPVATGVFVGEVHSLDVSRFSSCLCIVFLGCGSSVPYMHSFCRGVPLVLLHT